jgi:NitT/TauT family transport system substrate-binding protein
MRRQLDRRQILRHSAGLAAFGGATAISRSARAAQDGARFICDFRIYGATSPFLYGIDKGFFRDVGVDLTADGSTGSADAVVKVASGAYDFGCADISTLVEFASRNPQTAPRLIMPIYDRCSAAIVSPKALGITTMKQLEGHSLGTGTGDSGSRILPAIFRLQHIDASKINRQTLEVSLRDSMLLMGRVDAVVGNDYTVLFNLAGRGVKPEDMNLVYYADNGFDFYGQGLIVNQSVLARSPDLVKRVAIAVSQSWIAAAKNAEASVESALRRDKLLDATIENARLKWVLDRLVMTPNVRANGLGNFDMARFKRGIEVVAEGFQMTSIPKAEDMYDPSYMPDIAVRRI